MPVVASCPCGTRFVLFTKEFPRPVKCHNCGSRAVVNGPTEIGAGQGWRVGFEEPARSADAARPPGGPGCLVCGQTVCGACGNCGGFYCGYHGRARLLGGATCVRCYDGRRPLMILMAVLGVAGGIGLLSMPLLLPERVRNDPGFGWELLIRFGGACLVFLAAGFSLWGAFRRFP